MWLLLLGSIGLAGPRMVPDRAEVHAPIPPTRGALADGRELDLLPAKGDGAATALVFWSTGCATCADAIAAITAARDQRDDLVVYAVNVDRTPPDDRPPVLHGAQTVWDPEARILGRFDVVALPALVVVDDRGLVRLTASGPVDPSALEAALAAPAGRR